MSLCLYIHGDIFNRCHQSISKMHCAGEVHGCVGETESDANDESQSSIIQHQINWRQRADKPQLLQVVNRAEFPPALFGLK